MKKQKIVLFFGPNGAGKNTAQDEFVATLRTLCPHLLIHIDGVGAHFRHLLDEIGLDQFDKWPHDFRDRAHGRDLAEEMCAIGKTGGKQPFEAVKILLSEILETAGHKPDIIIIDGSLRDYDEINFWKKLMGAYDIHCYLIKSSKKKCFHQIKHRELENLRNGIPIRTELATDEGKLDYRKLFRKVSWSNTSAIHEGVKMSGFKLKVLDNEHLDFENFKQKARLLAHEYKDTLELA
jgi:hypothetical protein